MKIPLSQILKDKGVERTICLIVQAELEEANQQMTEKVEQLKEAEKEILLLKGRIMKLEQESSNKDEKLKKIKKELKSVKAVQLKAVNIVQEQQPSNTDMSDSVLGISINASSTHLEERTDHGEDPRKCGWFCVCGQEYRSKQSLDMHVKYFDTGYKFSCTRCPTRFVFATDMRKHLRSVHKIQPDPSMRYGCRQCGCFFWRITDLLGHRKAIHTKTKSIHRIDSKPSRVEKKDDSESLIANAPPTTMKPENPEGQGHGFAALLKASKIGDSTTNKQISKDGSTVATLKQAHRYICQCGKSYSSIRELRRHARNMYKTKQQNN